MAEQKLEKQVFTALQPLVEKKLKEKKTASQVNKMLSSSAALSGSPSVYAVTDKDGVLYKNSIFGVSFQQLRDFADAYPIARACINHRISQITQLDWNIAPVEVITKDDEEEDISKRAKEVQKSLKFPTGTKNTTFRGFITKIVEDALILDAVAIERIKNYGEQVMAWRPFDAATIELMLMPDGSTPEPPTPAYRQKVNGQITAELTTDDIYYGIMHPRTQSPYGLSALETLVGVVTTALKLQSYNLGYLTEGNVPEGFVEIPKDIASNPDQLAEWQRAWDAIFSGDPRYQRKLKFLPEGMVYHATKKQEDMNFERFEKWLLLNTCAVFKVPPQDIGFTFDSNKATSETQWEIGKERGMFPLSQFIKELIDQIIQEDLGHDDLEFVWLNLNPTNKLEEAKVFQILVNTGAVSVDEFRIGEGMKPIGVPHYISTPIGPIFAKDLVEQSEAGLQPTMPYGPAQSGAKAPQTGASPSGNNPEGSGTKTTNPETMRRQVREKQTGVNTKAAYIEELKKWRKVARNDLKSGMSFRKFSSDLIDNRISKMIDHNLSHATTRDEIDKVFDVFLNSEDNQLGDMKELHARISTIIQG